MRRLTRTVATVAMLLTATSLNAQTTGAPAGGPPPDGSKMPTGAEFIAQIDKNNDGVADKSEAASQERFAADFDKVDVDHDGKITPEEMTVFFAGMSVQK